MFNEVEVVDLFCGVGGLSYGLQRAGLPIAAGIDSDKSCQFAYETNIKARFIAGDISGYNPRKVGNLYGKGKIKILVGCAPCQPFSLYALKKKRSNDNRWELIVDFGKIIEKCKPEVVSMENVPNLKGRDIFQNLVSLLRNLGYFVDYSIVHSEKYGVPQMRRRLVLLASKIGQISIVAPQLENTPNTVRTAIKHLPKLLNGKADPDDRLHSCAALDPINLKRIRASKQDGTWLDWKANLLPDCYKKPSGQTFRNVYGRMSWDKPAPTLTTQFVRYGTGRFGHPDQDRALSLREGALLQSFPEDFVFCPEEEPVKQGQIARQIGNAVPPLLGKAIGESIINHIRGA